MNVNQQDPKKAEEILLRLLDYQGSQLIALKYRTTILREIVGARAELRHRDEDFALWAHVDDIETSIKAVEAEIVSAYSWLIGEEQGAVNESGSENQMAAGGAR